MDNYITVPSEQILESLPYSSKGDKALVEDTQKMYIYNGSSWVDMPKEQLKLSLLELNRNLIAQMPLLTKEQKSERATLFNKIINKTKNTFYLLYGKEISYFSLFMKDKNSSETFFETFQDCLKNLTDDIYSIDVADDNNDAIEIWVNIDGKTTFLYFFPYDLGVIPFKEA